MGISLGRPGVGERPQAVREHKGGLRIEKPGAGGTGVSPEEPSLIVRSRRWSRLKRGVCGGAWNQDGRVRMCGLGLGEQCLLC